MKSLLISMLLKNLIKDNSRKTKDIYVSGLSTNSKDVKKNHIFFAIKGSKKNGEKFINSAIKKGASVIVCSKSNKNKIKNNQYKLGLIIKTEQKICHKKSPRNI